MRRLRTDWGDDSVHPRLLPLLEAMPDAVLVCTANGRICFANANAGKLFGWPIEDLIGEPVEVLVPGDLQAKHAQLRAAYSQEPVTRPMDSGRRLQAVKRGGHRIPVDVSLSPLEGTAGIVTIVTVRDRRQLHRTQESLEQNKYRLAQLTSIQAELKRSEKHLQVVNKFALAVVRQNTVDDVLWCIARNAIADLGFEDCVVYLIDESRENLIQKAAYGPKSADVRRIVNPIVVPFGKGIVGSVALTGRPERIDDTRFDSRYIVDDTRRHSELAVPIIRDGIVIGVLDSEHSQQGFFTKEDEETFIAIASIASSKIDTALTMERLQKTVERLTEAESRLESQAIALRSARAEAEHASQAKSVFLAKMSHEIRTPLTAIVGFADLLGQSVEEEPATAEWVRGLGSNVDHLLALVNDVLDLSKIESGEVVPELRRCSLDALLDQVILLVKPMAEDKGLKLEVVRIDPFPAFIHTDELRVRQILINLLSNAIKFTSQGVVTVRVKFESGSDARKGRLRIDVADTGRGIESETLDRLFDPFTQDRPTLRAGMAGTGLGLTIARGFARLLGGDLSVRSELGEGSTFTLTLDAGRVGFSTDGRAERPVPATPRSRGASTALPCLRGFRIHLVEDSPDITRIIELHLRKTGAEVSCSENGADGVERVLKARARSEAFDLILMDMMMPVMDGYAATRALRQFGIRQPIIALTAFSMSDDRSKCLEAGCDEYVAKPIVPHQLYEAITRRIGEAKPLCDSSNVRPLATNPGE